MRSVFGSIWDVVKPGITGLIGTEESRQDKVTNLLIDKPFQFGADLGLYNAEKIPTPQKKERTNVYDLTTDFENMAQDSEVFRKNLPANLSEIGTGLIDIAMNPVESADTLLDITSGAVRNMIPDDSLLAQGLDKTDEMVGYDGMANREMAAQIYNDAKTFFATEGAMRDFALQNPGDLVALLLGSAYGINKIKNISPEKKAEVENIVKRIGATPVGLSIKNVGNSPFIDPAGYYLKAEKTILDMPQNSLPANQIEPFLKKKQISDQELENLGILSLIKNADPKEQITKQSLLDTIDDNRVSLFGTQLKTDSAEMKPGIPNQLVLTDMNFANNFYRENEFTDTYYVDEETPDGNTMSLLPQDEASKGFASDGYMENFTGSFERASPIVTTEAQRIAEEVNPQGRKLYPFELITDAGVLRSGQGNIGTGHPSLKDYKHAEVVTMMHELYPNKYPMTLGMQLKREVDRQMDLAYRNKQDVGGFSKAEKASQKAEAIIIAQLEDNQRMGIKEWDQEFLEEYANPEQDYTKSLISDEVEADFNEAVDAIIENEYLENPVLLQKIPVTIDDETQHYKVEYTPLMGYEVTSPDGLNMGVHGDLPIVQSVINDHARNRGYINADINNLGTGETKYSQWVSDAERQHMDTYSEELIRLSDGKPTSVVGGAGYDYDKGHFGEYKNTMAHIRKTIRGGDKFPNTVLGLPDNNPEVYHMGEFQSDWHQDGRQFGYTDEEYKRNKENYADDEGNYHFMAEQMETIDVKDFDIDDVRDVFDDMGEYNLKAADRYRMKKYGMTGTINNADGTVTGIHVDDMTKADFDKAWENSSHNPDSENFAPSEISLNHFLDYLDRHKEELDLYESKLERHTPTPRNPLKGDRIYTTGLTYAIKEAHKNGQKYVSWSNSQQVLDQWNEGGQRTDSRGNVQYKDLYVNTYDKKIPKAAEKLIKKYGGKLHEATIDGSKNKVIEITDEMIENIQKEFPDLPKDSKVLPFPLFGKASNIPSGLLQTDITNQEGLLA